MSLLARTLWLTLAVAATITALCLATSGCVRRISSSCNATFSTASYGSGPVTSEDRPLLGPIRSVTASGTVRVVILQAEKTSKTSLRITAPADILPRVVTRTEGSTLSINLLSGSYSGDIVVTVTTPAISGLHLSGATTAEATGVSGDRCDIELSGSSQATMHGSAKQVQVEISGASHGELTGVSAERWNIDCSGASTCVLAGTTRDAELEANGASTIDARSLQIERANAQAHGASTIHLGRVGSLRRETSGVSTITADQR